MSSWRLRQTYGFGAARLPLAPVFVRGPWTERESDADALARLADEIGALGTRTLLRAAGGALGLALTVACAVLAFAPVQRERDQTLPEIVLIERMPEQPVPVPEPLVEPEPEPLPLAEAKPEPEPAPPRAQPLPAAPRAEPERAPQPAPQPRFDAVAKAPEPEHPTPPRVARAEAPKRAAPSFRIDPVAPSFAVAATAPPGGQAAPLRAVSRPPAAHAAPPVTFPLDPLVADAKPAAAAPPPLPRAAPRPAPVRLASTQPARLPQFDAAPPPARYADAPASEPLPVQRVARAEAKRSAPAAVQGRAFQGVPLGALAACVSDREEDALKLRVMASAGVRRECASRAGRYRFVETRNLNAFLMWIERNPSRRPADRCVELRLALECLAGTPNRRTDNG
jgi:hypothetical protein